MAAGRKDGWWVFDGSSAELVFGGGNAHAFDPEKNSGSFTVMGEFAPDSISAGSGTLFSKWDEVAADRMWSIQQSDDDLLFHISADGSTPTTLTNASVLAATTDAFFCARYAKSTQDLFLDVDGVEVSNLSGPSSVHSAEADVKVANNVSAAGDFFDGKVYWLAFWNRSLSSSEVSQIRAGVHPCHYAPDFYIDFHQTVGATYVSEIPFDATQWPFVVTGSASRGGLTDPTLPDPVGVIATMEDVPLQMVSFFPEPQQPHASSQELGKAAIRDDVPIMITPMARPQVQRENAQELGIASLMRYNRKRGR